MEPQTAGQKCGRYWARNASGLYIERINDAPNCGGGSDEKQSSECWIVRQPDGTTLRLGHDEWSQIAVS